MPDAPTRESARDETSPAESPRYRLGVLLVHGIGTQDQGETLTAWGDALIGVLSRVVGPDVTVAVGSGDTGNEAANTPARLELLIQSPGGAERWLLAEAWWAKAFPPPGYADLVQWGFRALPWAVALHVAHRYWSADRRSRWRELAALGRAVGSLVAALAATPVALVLLALSFLLGLLPVEKLRQAARLVQTVLTATVGDSLAFVESPVRAALIRTRILEGLERLRSCCERTIVVAHSQGAAASLDALGGIAESAAPGETRKAAEPGALPDTLLTFGAGINQIVSLRVVSAGLASKLGNDPALWAQAAFLAGAGLCVWLYVGMRAHRYSTAGLLQALLTLLVAGAAAGFLAWAIHRLIPKLAPRRAAFQNAWNRIEAWVLVALFVGVVVGAITWANRTGQPLGPVAALLWTLLILAAEMGIILSGNMRAIVSAPVRKPPGLQRWVDIFASDDLVPNGPTRTEADGMLEPVRIWNRGSILRDHVTYWQNLDGFVLRVIQVCARTAESPWGAGLPEAAGADQRARWRVRYLKLAVWCSTLAWAWLFAQLWSRYGQLIPLPPLPDWTPASAAVPARLGVLGVAWAAVAWGAAQLVGWLWDFWVRAEQETVLAGRPAPAGMRWSWPTGMLAVPWSAVALVFAARAAAEAGPGMSWQDIPVVVFGWMVLSVLLLRWILPPPR